MRAVTGPRKTLCRRSFLVGAAALAGAAPLLAQEEPLPLPQLLADPLRPSTLALSLDGRAVEVLGYMAPPHAPEARHFALIAEPTPISPFNARGVPWPAHVLPVYTEALLRVIPFNVAIRARGRLEIGEFEDEAFGFASRLRLVDTRYARA